MCPSRAKLTLPLEAWKLHHVGALALHGGSDVLANHVRRLFQRIGGEVGIAGRGGRLRVAQQGSDDGQGQTTGNADAGEAVPQVVKPHLLKAGPLA